MWHWCQFQWHQMAKRLCCTSFQSGPKECSGAICGAIAIMWCSGTIDDVICSTWCSWWCQWHDMTKKVCHISFWSSWPSKWNGAIYNTGTYCQCHWHCMMLMSVPTVSNDWKSYIAYHFDNLKLTNSIVLLMMASVSCDVNTGITWSKTLWCTLFQASWSSKQNGPTDNVILGLTALHDKKSCHILFELSSPNEHIDAIDDTFSITWQECWYIKSPVSP